MAVIRKSTNPDPNHFSIGDCHDADKRNSVAVISKHSHQKPIHPNLYNDWRTTMQTEIEILETRENPAIVWW